MVYKFFHKAKHSFVLHYLIDKYVASDPPTILDLSSKPPLDLAKSVEAPIPKPFRLQALVWVHFLIA